jgi:NDP-sugar pyrophosphorylase family protein
LGDPDESLTAQDISAEYILSIVTGELEITSMVHPTAELDSRAKVSNSIIGPLVKIYEGVTVRDSIIMSSVQVGHSSEVARSVIFPEVSIPRFNYVGGTVIGARTRLGGCVSCATRRIDNADIVLPTDLPTGVSKFGSVVGRDCHIGFACHLNPGSLLGEECIIHPYVDVRGHIPSKSQLVSTASYRIIKRRSFKGSPFPDLG